MTASMHVPPGGRLHAQPTCFGCGTDNPAGLHGAFAARGDEVHGTMTVTDTMVGAPGRMHGGIVMAFLDEGLGLVTAHHGADAMTASLTVDLRTPAIVGAILRQRAWLERRDGRKWFVRGEVHEGDRLVAEASGLWIEPRG
jgi:acyl-coenzyme A thioesterase PaaI-like protein